MRLQQLDLGASPHLGSRPRPLPPQQAMETIKGLAGVQRYQLSPHARQRMRQRGVRELDIWYALIRAQECRRSDGPRWRVVGPNRGGEHLGLVVLIHSVVIVVTTYWIDREPTCTIGPETAAMIGQSRSLLADPAASNTSRGSGLTHRIDGAVLAGRPRIGGLPSDR